MPRCTIGYCYSTCLINVKKATLAALYALFEAPGATEGFSLALIEMFHA